MKDAAKIEWPKQTEQKEKVKERFKDDPAKQKQELDRLSASFKKTHGSTYYKDLETGRTARATWAYPGAKYAGGVNFRKVISCAIPRRATFTDITMLTNFSPLQQPAVATASTRIQFHWIRNMQNMWVVKLDLLRWSCQPMAAPAQPEERIRFLSIRMEGRFPRNIGPSKYSTCCSSKVMKMLPAGSH